MVAQVQNLCLSLHADGIGTKWTTGPVNFDPRFAAAAGLPAADSEYVVGTLWFGAAAGVPPPALPRRLAEAPFGFVSKLHPRIRSSLGKAKSFAGEREAAATCGTLRPKLPAGWDA